MQKKLEENPFGKEIPEKYKGLFEDKNKNGKPDFFEDSTLNIIKKLINLFTQKDPQLYGYKKINPSVSQLFVFILIVIGIAVFAVQFLPFVIFIVIIFLSNFKKIKDGSNTVDKEKQPSNSIQTITTVNNSQNSVPQKPSPYYNPSNDFQNNFSNGIRVILLIALIGYCLYLAWSYLQAKFF